jgi:acetyl-CoA synthetase
VVITADEGLRGGRKVPLKGQCRQGAGKLPDVEEAVIVVKRTGGDVAWEDGRDVWYHEEPAVPADCPGRDERRRPAVHPLHLRLHRQAQGRAAHHRRLPGLRLDDARVRLRLHDGDVYWCTADVGWVTGHSYIVYGPLANGATTLMFEGVPNYPGRLALLGGLSTSTRSTSSTPRRPPSAR